MGRVAISSIASRIRLDDDGISGVIRRAEPVFFVRRWAGETKPEKQTGAGQSMGICNMTQYDRPLQLVVCSLRFFS
jgi:hypothetical protein